MRKRRDEPSAARNAILPGLLIFALLAAEPASGDVEKLADASFDRVGATTAVPDPSRKLGEVRLVARGRAVVVQTLLRTKLLSRVTAEIARKEAANWPKDDEPTRRYVEALNAARRKLESRRDGRVSPEKPRLLIEFAADDDDAIVLIGTFGDEDGGERITPTQRQIFASLSLPRAYVLRNMRLILADSFRIAEREVDRLGPLGPASAERVPAVMPPKDAPAMPVAGDRPAPPEKR